MPLYSNSVKINRMTADWFIPVLIFAPCMTAMGLLHKNPYTPGEFDTDQKEASSFRILLHYDKAIPMKISINCAFFTPSQSDCYLIFPQTESVMTSLKLLFHYTIPVNAAMILDDVPLVFPDKEASTWICLQKKASVSIGRNQGIYCQCPWISNGGN